MYAGVCLKNIRTYQEVYQISIHDELTGLYNRGYFKKVSGGELERRAEDSPGVS